MELFIDENQAEEFKCSICIGVVEKPRILRCGHIFCHHCIFGWISNQAGGDHLACPNCRAQIGLIRDQSGLRLAVNAAPQEIYNIINALEMKCCNESKGCNVVIPYSHIVKHIDGECQIRDILMIREHCR